MIKTVLYIATSIDGYIARPDGNLDWLTSIPEPDKGDYGYTTFLETVGTLIMGRKTYEEIMGFGVDWPYRGRESFVVTRNQKLEIKSPDTCLLTENLKTFVSERKAKEDRDIWLVGGGELVTAFINEGLLDKMIITVIPKIIGEGIALFADKPAESDWILGEVNSFNTGVVSLTYERKATADTTSDSKN